MKAWSAATENDLRRLLNEWDPIGVADLVQDEYDCMLAPLLGRLCGGAGQTEIGAFLRHELEDHFGLGSASLRPDAMASRVIAWWTPPDQGSRGSRSPVNDGLAGGRKPSDS